MNTTSKITPPREGGIFIARATLVDEMSLRSSLRRIAHEILEHNENIADVELVGILRGGVPIAHGIASALGEITKLEIPVNELDITAFRDDNNTDAAPEVSEMLARFADKTVVLVDDVLFTGRTVRAALNTVFNYGRPRRVQLAVVVDRGHRELPIRADYVVKNVPTKSSEHIRVSLQHGVELGEFAAEGAASQGGK